MTQWIPLLFSLSITIIPTLEMKDNVLILAVRRCTVPQFANTWDTPGLLHGLIPPLNTSPMLRCPLPRQLFHYTTASAKM